MAPEDRKKTVGFIWDPETDGKVRKLAGRQEGGGQERCSGAEENLPSLLQRKDSSSFKRDNVRERDRAVLTTGICVYT